MIRVSNKACVRHLGRQSMKAAKTRNCIAVLAIALTTVLFTSLFTIALSINDGFQQSNFRQAGGYNHATFKSLTQEQFGEIKEDPLIKEWGLRRFIGMPTEAPFHKSHVEIGYSDPTQAKWMFCQPQEGRLPQEGTNEAATDTRVLELLGVEPVLGAEFTLTFGIGAGSVETTQTFTLCGWWEYDEAIPADHVLIPESRLESILAETGYVPGQDASGAGLWGLDV
ncbi:MAG: ABC transporter permease, partial [Evtepia gabavorous]